MSSIIDALKKSDQNRTSENQSGINDINFSDTRTPKSRRGFWLLVVVLLLVTVGVFAWQQGWHQKLLTAFENNEPKIETVEQKPITKNTPATKTVTNKEKDPATVKQQTPNNQLVPPKQDEIKQKAELAKKQELNSINIAKVEDNKKVEQKPEALEIVDDKSKKIKVLGTAAKKQEQIEPKDPTKTPNKKPDNSSLEPTLKQDYLLLHQIDFTIRKNIPKIKINIHIYDPEPENRMVLINGERYNIGDQIEAVLTIIDIVQEGIVVSFENLEFLIPK